ncbi:restriction endonuclease subunit S [Rhizobium laguerreae]|uniref:restriction endonuclease subunit S n=1 Tax=Rhizobium laguerreae TaxID=1076926 RepID=UPI001C91FD35|nr:restriction endonuclease subunit S [Rhizobium laguerreae]MBY3239644.1 restriction endonuclease subunit S [Rhizobium laguerreae]
MSWTNVTVGDAFDFVRNGKSIKQSKEVDGLPITRIETIADRIVDPARVGYAGLNEAGNEQWLLRNGDILFSHINSVDHIGKCAIYEGVPEKLLHGMNLLALRPGRLLHPKFAYYALSHDRFRARLLPFVNKAVNQASVSTTNLKTLEIPLPHLAEQKRIAAILDKADQLRQKRRQAIALLDSLTQSIFLEMFGDPVSNPKGWQWSKLGEIGNLDRGVSKHRPRNDPRLLGGAHPLIQTGDVSNSSGYIRAFRSTYSDLGLSQSKMWPAGTLCITIAANIASTGILTFPACFPDSVVGFSSSRPGMSQYVRVWMSFLKKTLETIAPAVAQKNINLAILRELDIPLPSAESLRKFNLAMDQLAIEQEKSRLQKQNSGVLFASLQHRAFSGQL